MDFYLILGVERAATLVDIKRAYKRLARRYHPDINPGDRTAAQQFRQIAEAYETLSDADRRRRYDTLGVIVQAVDAQAFGFDGFDFSVSVSGAQAPTFGDLFAEVLQQRETGARDAADRGADLHLTLALGFEDAMQGGEHVMLVTRLVHCEMCNGHGRLRTAESRCIACHGAGILKTARGHMVFSRPCAECRGTGRKADVVCPGCGGHQMLPRTDSLAVNLAPGLGDEASVRVPQCGHAGRDGGEAGDLYVTVRVEPHPAFRREGDDIHVVVPISIHEAALGAKIDVPSIDGKARLKIPPGTQSGQRFRVRERGVPSARDGRRGDLVVEVRLMLPRVLDERSKELLREFGRINAEDVRDA
ncbi:MAG TPA: J domain-containing protein [Vicinamibacterales bacterium]|nr:J domain-containing protein [Vicinamibacterales bacterium]